MSGDTSSTPFWEFFSSLLRHTPKEGSDERMEAERARKCCLYLIDHETWLRNLFSEREAVLIYLVKKVFKDNGGEAPHRDSFKSAIEDYGDPKVLELFEDDFSEGEFNAHDSMDIKSLVKRLEDEVMAAQMLLELDTAKAILKLGKKFKVNGEIIRKKGATDAAAHLMNRLNTTNLIPNVGRHKGNLNNSARRELMEIFNENLNLDGSKSVIATGLAGIDDVISFKRGQFVGILGFAGMRKTSLARTWAYNAAMQGFNVMHITFEQSYSEEMIQYALMHSRNPKFGEDFRITAKQFDLGDLTPEESRFLFSTVVPDFQNIPGDLYIQQPIAGGTWENVESLINARESQVPPDMIVIDYLTLCTTHSTSHSTEEMNDIIKQAKQLALNGNKGKGYLIVTPVQGNREGKENAAKNEGQWDMSGVYKYSEFDKSVDTMLSVYLDDDLKSLGEIIISSAKSRRSDTIKPFKAGVDPGIGQILSLNRGNASSSKFEVEDVYADEGLVY